MKAKILLIEDDLEIIETISLSFRINWPEAELISSRYGKSGIELAESKAHDTIILDLGLPDISGFQVLGQIRLFSSVPIIILTASVSEGDRVAGLALGVNDYLVKPFKQREFIERLKAQIALIRVTY